MALLNCPDCNSEVSDKAQACPKCGCPIEAIIIHDEEETKKKLIAEENRRKIEEENRNKEKEKERKEFLEFVKKKELKKNARKKLYPKLIVVLTILSVIVGVSLYKFNEYYQHSVPIIESNIRDVVFKDFKDKPVFMIRYPESIDNLDTFIIEIIDDRFSTYTTIYNEKIISEINNLELPNIKLIAKIPVNNIESKIPTTTREVKKTTERKIKYVVESPGTVSVTYQNSDGNTSQANDTYTTEFSVNAEEGDFYYFSAQNSKDYGSVKITMYVNGVEYMTNSSTGGYCIATVSGSLD